MKRIFLGMIAFVNALGCSSTPVQSLTSSSGELRLFPNGVYHHFIELTIQKDSGDEDYSFKGLVRLEPNKNQVIGLTPFFTTAFHLEDALDGSPVQLDIRFSPLRRLEPRFREYYEILKPFLRAQKKSATQNPSQLTVQDRQGRPYVVELKDYDANQIPGRFEVVHEKFKIRVTVESYELLEN